jgi:hypothetical protein
LPSSQGQYPHSLNRSLFLVFGLYSRVRASLTAQPPPPSQNLDNPPPQPRDSID